MGAKNPDRQPVAELRAIFPTAGHMLRGGWDVISHCRKCGLTMTVNLRLIVRVSGPETILWDRTERCRRIGCQGQVEFQGHTPAQTAYQALSAPWPGERY